MLVAFQVLNKILQTKDINFIKSNSLDDTYFTGFTDEFHFIVDHYKQNGNVPDILTFQAHFPKFQLTEVNESDDYLLDKLHEEYGYEKFRKIMPELDNKLKEDSRLAYDYLRAQMEYLKPRAVCNGKDIIKEARERLDAYLKRGSTEVPLTISTGFKEQDEILGGWEMGEELVTIVARTNQGKSWILMKYLAEAWKQGKRVGLYSGEMSHLKLGYRFDALFEHLSNRALVRGYPVPNYVDYISNLEQMPNPFIIITQNELGGRPTVQHLRRFIEENQLDILGVDQLSLMEDGRASRNDPPRMRLSHIAEDLFQLSTEYKIPILALAQANRAGINKDDSMEAPGLENIKESDDIAHNSSKCIGIRQSPAGLVIDIIKNREGRVGDKLLYNWDIDLGEFTYMATPGDAATDTTRNAVAQRTKEAFAEATHNNCVF